MSALIFMIKKNDRGLVYPVTVQDKSGNKQDLTGATIKCSMRLTGASSNKINAQTAGITIDADQASNTGNFTYTFQAGETDTSCTDSDTTATELKKRYNLYQIEFEITLSGGTPFTVPADPRDPWFVLITDDLDAT